MYYGASIGTSSAHSADKAPEMPRGSVSESEVPPFSTQDGLENITFNEVEEGETEREKRSTFNKQEDELLISTWLNISKDAIVGTDQSARAYWDRIATYYNKYHSHLKRKTVGQLKSRWNKLNPAVQKFVGCYKAAFELNRSGTTESDTIEAAKRIFEKDYKQKFILEHAWCLLKNEPKWVSRDDPSKRGRLSESGAYTSSSNLDTPTSEYNPTSPTFVRPPGRKATKRKGKEKIGETSSNNVSKTVEALKRLATVKEKEVDMKDEYNKRLDEHTKRMDKHSKHLEEHTKRMEEHSKRIEEKSKRDKDKMWLDILYKDTSTMTAVQLQDHDKICRMIRNRLGI